MKKNHMYGITALVLGVLLLIPLILAGYAGKAGGSESFFRMVANFTATGTPTWYVLSAIFTILTIIGIACLVVTGILLIVGVKPAFIQKLFKYTTITTGIVALLSAFCAMLLAITYTLPVIGGKPFNVGVGAILLLIISIPTIMANFITKKIIKRQSEKPQRKEKVPQTKNA